MEKLIGKLSLKRPQPLPSARRCAGTGSVPETFVAARDGRAGAQELSRRASICSARSVIARDRHRGAALQAFLRAAAVELVAAVADGAADGALYARHARMLEGSPRPGSRGSRRSRRTGRQLLGSVDLAPAAEGGLAYA